MKRCDECGSLVTHVFRTGDDLVHAVQVAAAEVDRGVLRRIRAEDLSNRQREAIESAFASGELPANIRYAFQCTVCGDRFELVGDTAAGSGAWTRAEPE